MFWIIWGALFIPFLIWNLTEEQDDRDEIIRQQSRKIEYLEEKSTDSDWLNVGITLFKIWGFLFVLTVVLAFFSPLGAIISIPMMLILGAMFVAGWLCYGIVSGISSIFK